jgi:hypothetical protein
VTACSIKSSRQQVETMLFDVRTHRTSACYVLASSNHRNRRLVRVIEIIGAGCRT